MLLESVVDEALVTRMDDDRGMSTACVGLHARRDQLFRRWYNDLPRSQQITPAFLCPRGGTAKKSHRRGPKQRNDFSMSNREERSLKMPYAAPALATARHVCPGRSKAAQF